VKHIRITKEDVDRAKKLSTEMGKLNNSIMKGKGNITGFLGEIITANYLGTELSNTYDYDIIFNNFKIDVKSKKVTTPPRDHYECSVAALNTKQDCDVYIFTRILPKKWSKHDYSEGWLLGYMDKKDYLKRATFLKKGQVDPSNNWKVRTDCYNLPINELNNLQVLKELYE
tara:strand:+ start:530 stop:1042 length:513 start_codon:yes stop_codon:yes gene_type:complete